MDLAKASQEQRSALDHALEVTRDFIDSNESIPSANHRFTTMITGMKRATDYYYYYYYYYYYDAFIIIIIIIIYSILLLCVYYYYYYYYYYY